MGRGLIVALALSLALNVFAAGFITARLVGPHGPPHPHAEAGHRGFDNPFRLMRHAEALPPESRETFRAAIKKRLPALRTHHEEMRSLRGSLWEQLAEDDWDRAAIEAQMEAIRQTQARQHEAFDAAFLAAFETLSPEDRQVLMKAAEERRKERRERFKRRREERRGAPTEEE